jgi:signal transduction histidine kinase
VAVSDRRPGPVARLRLRSRLLILFGFAGLALVLVVAALLLSLAQLSHRRDAVVDKLDPAELAVGQLRAAMLDQETGVRGYVLSRDGSFLEPYVVGLTDGEDAFSRLELLLDGTDVASGELAAARAAVDEWRSGYATRAVQSVTEGDRSLVTSEFLADSRTAFDTVRSSLDGLNGAIVELRAEALDDWQAAFRTVVVVAVVAIVVLVVVGVLVAIGLRRSVTEPVEELASEVRRVSGGELSSAVRGHGPPELVGLGDDIEAMRRRILAELDRVQEATEAIAQQAVELERSNADLEQFAYVASHDLQEPLRKIAGFCQLLERRYRGQLDDKADQYIDFVVDGAKRMQDLINDLLAFSRVGRTTERFVTVDLNAAADAALANLGSVPADQGATVDVGELPSVEGDPRLLAALFQNLIGNAVKFRGDEPPVVEIRAEVRDDDCTVTVTDNGIGIDPEYGDQIFTIFQRLHNKSHYDGTGIGLALCKKIVEFHGGSIWLDADAPGRGATFRFTLPTHAEIPAPVVAPSDDRDTEGRTGTGDEPARPSTDPPTPSNDEVLTHEP